MKKNLLLLMAIMVAMTMQAQTCKVAASKNNGRIVQIEVNLDSLEGKTLVTTINNVQKIVKVNMELQGGDEEETPTPVISREDSSEKNIAEVNADTTTVSTEDLKNEDEVADQTVPNPEPAPASNMLGGIPGLGDVTSLFTLFSPNGEQYQEFSPKGIIEADFTKYIPQYKERKWKWLKNYESYTVLEVSGNLGKDFGGGGGDDNGDDQINPEDYGGTDPNEDPNNYGGSLEMAQVFVKGHYDANGKFIPNHLNFGWSLGLLIGVDNNKDYGWSSDVLAKIGMQAGTGFTLGVDALIGGGTTPYAIYSSNGIDYRVVMHNQLCFKLGVQGWLSMNYGSNTYTKLYARYITSIVPSSVYNHPTAEDWDNELIDFDKKGWQVGFAIGFKLGYHANLRTKRLQATVGLGQNLTGSKATEMLVSLEKINQVSPTTQFSYGLGVGQTFGKDKLNSFTAESGWTFKLKPTNKLYYIAKLYAGVGEYMLEKRVVNDNFDMNDTGVKQICLKGGANLGVGYQIGSSLFSATLRGGYRYGFDTEYDGFITVEEGNKKGFDFIPMLGWTLNF